MMQPTRYPLTLLAPRRRFRMLGWTLTPLVGACAFAMGLITGCASPAGPDWHNP